jgi:hypothetical protein
MGFQLAGCVLVRIDDNAAFGAAVWQVDERAFSTSSHIASARTSSKLTCVL